MAHTFTAAGNANTDNAQAKFGTTSCEVQLLTDYISAPDSADFAFGTGDFTIEGFFYADGNASNGYILSQGQVDTSFALATYGGGVQPACYFSYATNNAAWSYADFPGGALSQNAWHHCAMVRSGTEFYGYSDGTRYTIGTGNSTAMDDSAAAVLIGENGGVNGWVDEVRVIKGTAMYTASTITVPTVAFDQCVQACDLLLHMEGTDGGTSFLDSSDDACPVTLQMISSLLLMGVG